MESATRKVKVLEGKRCLTVKVVRGLKQDVR